MDARRWMAGKLLPKAPGASVCPEFGAALSHAPPLDHTWLATLEICGWQVFKMQPMVACELQNVTQYSAESIDLLPCPYTH